MPHRSETEANDDDDDWSEEDSDDGLMDCPYCGEEMFEDSPRCPSCGRYLSEEDAPVERKPPWIVMTAVILLVLMLGWAVNFL